MTVPLQVLAVGAVLVGYLGIPPILGHLVHVPNVFEHFLEPVFQPAHHALQQVFTHVSQDHSMEWLLMGASVGVGLLGIFVARHFYKTRPEIPERLAGTFAPVHRVLLNKYYVDEVYGKLFVRGAALGGGNLLWATDRHVVDGGDGDVRPGLGVNGIGWLTRDVVAAFSNAWDRYVVDGIVNLTAAFLDQMSYVFRALQNGLVQYYALSMLIVFFLMVGASALIL
jgi:NADH-quinone oxidoreductase subunit L